MKGEYACTNGFCMMGALGFGNNMAQPDGRNNLAKYSAEEILFRLVQDETAAVFTVVDFNDHVAKTEADVVEMFDWAIGIAEAGGL